MSIVSKRLLCVSYFRHCSTLHVIIFYKTRTRTELSSRASVAPVTVAGLALRGDNGTTAAVALASCDLRLGLLLPAVAALSFLPFGDWGGGLKDLPEPLPRFIVRSAFLESGFTNR
jgi:hypothetical protein